MLETNDFIIKQTILVFCNDEKISILNDNVLIKDKDGKTKLQATCYRLFAIYIIGHTTLTTALIDRAKKFGFVIVLFSSSFKIYEVIGFKRDANTLLHRTQYEYDSLEIAKWLIKNKINNQIRTLSKQREKQNGKEFVISDLKVSLKKLETATSLSEIMGIEGTASKQYFKQHFLNVGWKGRAPRIKRDYINSILDIGYTVLFAYVESILCIYGFDVYVGVMHTLFYMRKSLVCDLIEPFRCIIDAQTKKSLNLNQFKESDFVVHNYRYELSWENSPKYVSTFVTAILERRKEIFLFFKQYYRCFIKKSEINLYPDFNI